MSWQRSPPTLDLALAGSAWLAAAAAGAYALAVAAVLASGIPWPAKACASAALVAFGAWWIAARGLRLAPWSICRLVWYPEGDCVLVRRDGATAEGQVVAGDAFAGVLATVQVRIGRRRHTLAVTRAATDAEGFRRLCVRLTVAPPGAERNAPVARWISRLRRRRTSPDGR